jgi:4-amino-4-deoxy-L-arabinose transferase-like glycosyltransferase
LALNEPRSHTRNRRLFIDPWLATLVTATFLIRVGYNLALHPDGHPPWAFVIDEREYFAAAHVLAEGRGFSFFDTALWVRPPVYVLLLAAVMRVAGTDYLPVLTVQSALSAATLMPLSWLAGQMGGRAAARWTAVLAALYLPLTLFSGLLLSETVFLLLFTLALVALLRSRQILGALTAPQEDAHLPRLRACAWVALSGVLLGLAVLTRATALAFIPVSALWLISGTTRETDANDQSGVDPRNRDRDSRRLKWLSGGLLLAACAVVLLPWVLRNYRAYRVVAVDTTAAYNLWLGSVGVRDEQRLQADLRRIPNHAERQAFAFSEAWENISAAPHMFIVKGIKETLDLWRPHFSSEERQVAGYTLGRVPAWHLAALLTFDDLLYVLILMLALVGLMLTPPHPLKALIVLWVLVWVAMAFVFFAVTRFRLPVVAALLPLAGVGVVHVASRHELERAWRALASWKRGVALVGAVAVVLVTLPAISAGDVFVGMQRWHQQASFRTAESLLRDGRPEDAIRLYRQANLDLLDTRYALAAAYLQGAQVQQALSLLKADEPPDRFEPFIIRGEAARMSGDLEAARSFFNAREVREAGEEALVWAWDHLRPPPVESLVLGTGLDVGYVRGFYAPETADGGVPFRWTGPRAEIRGLKSRAPGILRLSLTQSGWRPEGLSQAQVVLSVRANGDQSAARGDVFYFRLPNDSGWHVQEVQSSRDRADVELVLQMTVNPFVPGGYDPRLLGIRLAGVATER